MSKLIETALEHPSNILEPYLKTDSSAFSAIRIGHRIAQHSAMAVSDQLGRRGLGIGGLADRSAFLRSVSLGVWRPSALF